MVSTEEIYADLPDLNLSLVEGDERKEENRGVILTGKQKQDLINLFLLSPDLIKQAYFETDNLQEIFLYNSMRENRKFLRTMHTTFTAQFIEFLIRKTDLNEPIGISVKGVVRGGKSTFGITIACLLCALRGRKMNPAHICKSEFDFLDKIKDAQFGDVFIIDESKFSVYGIGSVAKRMKLKDIQNIIAVKNISTIYITPREFNDTNSDYGFHILGRARECKPRMIRALLYNLQERGVGTYIPYGIVTFPVFMDVFNYGAELNKEYMAKKLTWVDAEQKSETSIMYDIQINLARTLLTKPEVTASEKMKERYIIAKRFIPDEYTQQEKEEIVKITFMIQRGLIK